MKDPCNHVRGKHADVRRRSETLHNSFQTTQLVLFSFFWVITVSTVRHKTDVSRNKSKYATNYVPAHEHAHAHIHTHTHTHARDKINWSYIITGWLIIL